jgi:aspartate aminotransferase-like enzyme
MTVSESTFLTAKPILLAPGPVQLHPEVQKILSLPMIHHRTPEFDGIFKTVLKNLKYLFQTKNDVYIQTSTGSGGMECVLVNVLNPGDHVLAVVSGKFGERWADMAETFGAIVHRLNCPWGHAVQITDVIAALKAHPEVKIVLTQACETSTATTHPIQELGKLLSTTNVLFLVDGITATGAFPTPMDEWHIDGLVAGSQKAVMLPTGLSFVSFSQKAWPHILKNKMPRFYFDIRKEQLANQKGESFFSAPVPLIRSLDFVLKEIENISLEKHFKIIHSRAEYTRLMSPHLHLELFSKSPSDSVTAYLLPPNFEGAKFREHLEKKYALTVMGGQDQLKGKVIRLGHMGFISREDLHQTSLRIASGLNDFGFKLNLDEINSISQNLLKSY